MSVNFQATWAGLEEQKSPEIDEDLEEQKSTASPEIDEDLEVQNPPEIDSCSSAYPGRVFRAASSDFDKVRTEIEERGAKTMGDKGKKLKVAISVKAVAFELTARAAL
ncbi:hypothetical protein RHSIM_Rhsim08G0155800 [Rhododendron simsii]|uniref:Uncharacterized protein n=1 Tax=Rhododendron simsii TaxID=118357 RepID=A0A834LIB8_RHOSS|nr:hypothetical protein RHSIM_Rhsim08G0155800 [Rhododendron simsii]